MTDAVRSIDLVPYALFLSFPFPYCVVRITNLHGRETPYLNHIVICHPGGIGTPPLQAFRQTRSADSPRKELGDCIELASGVVSVKMAILSRSLVVDKILG